MELPMFSDDRDPVDVLAEEFADRLRRGEHPSVSAYAAAHPEYADQLKELLPAVAQMEMLKRFRHPAAAEPSLPDRLGEFRIIRELGRGGMGVVFEAVQESLGRSVALKILARHAQLDSTRRERFIREAQAAARLHHTNIVPVFGVGEQDGLPYYAMQLIRGHGLHAIVWQWRKQAGKISSIANETRVKQPDTKPNGPSGPTSSEGEIDAPEYGNWQFIAEVGLQTAYALHYAHKQGILHRDMKPANLIFDGETVWVTDFGLAKLLNADGLTATGDILGTLQYLPPESLAGEVDARSDVYGLGATLYELLTLEPPYASDSPARLIKQVADADPPPPRELNPDIPRDLETIVLKAMARRPEDRYATARELAADLEAFLEDRPIKARRTSAISRAWRWCRRNPAVASLTLSTLVALLLAATAGWVGYARTTAALKREEDRRHDAEREQKKAEEASKQLEENLKLSLDTFAKVFDAAGGTDGQGFGIPMPPPVGGAGHGPGGHGGPGGPSRIEGGPGDPAGGPAADSASAKAAVLEVVLNFYDKFAEQNSSNTQLPAEATRRLQFEAAKASRRMCEAYVWLKRPEKAVAAFRRGVGLLGPLVALSPEKDEYRSELLMVYAVAPPEAFPNDRDLPLRRVAELANGNAWLAGTGQFRIGFAREQAHDLPGAESAYRDAIASLTSVELANRPSYGHIDLAFARLRLARILSLGGRMAAARKVLEESVDELRPFADRPEGRPPSRGEGHRPPTRELMGMTYWSLGGLCERLSDRNGADSAYRKANQYGDRFGGFHPGGKGGGPGGPWGKKDGPPPKKDGWPKK